MDESKALYKQILKSTSLFGSVQVFNIIISIMRSKAIAFFIGSSGMGISGLLLASTNLIYSITSLGLDTSSVKYISQANTDISKTHVNKIINILKQLVWFIGIVGSLIVIIFSSYLSKFTFGNDEYRWSFIWISITLLFKSFSNSHYAILQGLGKLKHLAKANFYGSFFGLLITIPLYYYLGIKAIVPAIIISSFITVLVSLFYTNKLNIKRQYVSKNELLSDGKKMIHLGVMLSMSGLMTTMSAYLLQIYISYTATINDVGFYIAGMTILNSYVGVVFIAMSTDYYPRLSAIVHKEEAVREIVGHQSIVGVLIIMPIVCLFIPLAPFVLKLFYTSQFLSVVPMITYGIIGMLFKAVSFSMGYILFAKGDSKMFLRTSLGFNITFLIMNIIAFQLYGLIGLGVSFAVYFFLHFLILKMITHKRYGFYFEKEFYKIFFISIVLCLLALLVNLLENAILKNVLAIIVVIIAVLFSFLKINKKIDVLDTMKKYKSK